MRFELNLCWRVVIGIWWLSIVIVRLKLRLIIIKRLWILRGILVSRRLIIVRLNGRLIRLKQGLWYWLCLNCCIGWILFQDSHILMVWKQRRISWLCLLYWLIAVTGLINSCIRVVYLRSWIGVTIVIGILKVVVLTHL